MIEINLEIRVDVNEGLTFRGFEEVNGLINCGGKVMSIEHFSSWRQSGKESDKEYRYLFGWGMKVIMDNSLVDTSPATLEHRRLFKEGSDLISPYMHLEDRIHQSEDSEKARGELELGISLLRKVISINPANWSAYWYTGKAYQALGNWQAACTEFGKSFALNKDHADVANEYAVECLKLGWAEKGITAAKHAVNLRSDDASLVANLALALLIGGKPDEATENIANSLAMKPDDKINQNISQLIADVLTGRRPQPSSLEELCKPN